MTVPGKGGRRTLEQREEEFWRRRAERTALRRAENERVDAQREFRRCSICDEFVARTRVGAGVHNYMLHRGSAHLLPEKLARRPPPPPVDFLEEAESAAAYGDLEFPDGIDD